MIVLPAARQRTPETLALMRAIDQQFLEIALVQLASDGAPSPAAGLGRRGRHRIRRLMAKMSLVPIYHAPEDERVAS